MKDGLKQFFAGIAFIAALGMVYGVGYMHGAANKVAGKVSVFVDKVGEGVDGFNNFRDDVRGVGKQVKETKDEFIAEIKSIFRFKIGKNGEYILVPPNELNSSDSPDVSADPITE